MAQAILGCDKGLEKAGGSFNITKRGQYLLLKKLLLLALFMTYQTEQAQNSNQHSRGEKMKIDSSVCGLSLLSGDVEF